MNPLTSASTYRISQKHRAAFTLVELAIVLVIIGLIIGGVLVGQDLIKSAEIRGTITQVQNYNAAVNTFHSKYRSLPGDVNNITRFYDSADWPLIRDGNGNRKIEVCAGGPTDNGACASGGLAPVGDISATPTHSGEALQFWYQLSMAGLISGFYNGCAKGTTCDGVPAGYEGRLGASFPISKLERNGIGVFSDGALNYYQIGITEHNSSAAYIAEPGLTAREAHEIDSKIDDGKPGTGIIVVRSSQSGGSGTRVNASLVTADGSYDNTPATQRACINESVTDGITTWTYAMPNPEASCSIRMRMN